MIGMQSLGRVVAVKVEADGDLHLALQDATGDKPGVVVCEITSQTAMVRAAHKRSLTGLTPNFHFTLVRPKR